MKRRDFLKAAIITGAASGVELSCPVSFGQNATAGLPASEVRGLTSYVADFAARTKYEDIPETAAELGKKSILDAIGLALFGATQETWRILQRYSQAFAGDRGATVLGTAVKLPARFAAFSNGVAIHVSDYDDTQLAVAKDRVYGLLTHPTVPVLPAIFAVAEAQKRSGRDLLLAYQIGVEVECKLAEAISPRHYEAGFHTTGTCGVFGAVTGVGKLLGFNREQICRAMGIAGSQASGLGENFGTMMKPFHAGHAAEVGVFSSDLEGLGWTASDKILESSRGFFSAYGGGYDPASIQDHLGKPWTLANPGVSIKPFPCGSLTHPAMGEALRLIGENNIRPAEVRRIDVGTNGNNLKALIHHQPKNALQAKFSMEFCIAILVLERKAGLTEFSDQVVNRADVQEMIQKVHFGVDPRAEAAGYDKMTSIVTFHLADGRTISGTADFAKGSPSNPMSYGEVAEKFHGCCAAANWPQTKADAIADLVHELEKAADIDALMRLCSA